MKHLIFSKVITKITAHDKMLYIVNNTLFSKAGNINVVKYHRFSET